MTSRDNHHNSIGGGATTGFLFGNIDKRGRLDEDYLDDDVKDNLDHVGTKMTEKDRELREISEALPIRNDNTNDDDDEDYDEDDSSADEVTAIKPNQADPNQVDYYDETDEELDEEERAKLAKFALDNAQRNITGGASSTKKQDDDDENYDDDDEDYDEDGDSSMKPNTTKIPTPDQQLKTLTQESSQGKLGSQIVNSEKGQPSSLLKSNTPQEAKIQSGKESSPSKSNFSAQDRAMEEQNRLLGEARERAKNLKPYEAPIAVKEEVSDMVEEEPLSFLNAFFKPPRPLVYIPNRQRYGLPTIRTAAPQKIQSDDREELDRETSLPSLNAVDAILALDAKNAAQREPESTGLEADQMDAERQLSKEEVEEYGEAAAPLVMQNENNTDAREDDIEMTSSGDKVDEKKKHNSLPNQNGDDFNEYALVQQVGWEKEIVWEYSTSADDDDDSGGEWYKPDMEENLNAADKKMNDMALENNDNNSDDSDDDDEFEDPVIINADDAGKSSTDVKDKNKDNADGNDSDSDDMEWEDGDANVTEEVPKPQTSNGLTGLRSSPMKADKKDEVTNNRNDKVNDNVIDNADHDNVSQEDDDCVKELLSFKSELVKKSFAPNKDLQNGKWIDEIKWSSDSDCESIEPKSESSLRQYLVREDLSSRLILDMNDSAIVVEQLTIDSSNIMHIRHREKKYGGFITPSKCSELLSSSGTHVQQLLESDRFNISNDIYYASGASNFLKVDRQSILRGLQNAPPAVKCQTTKSTLPEYELLSFRRPKLNESDLPLRMELVPSRRKRHKGGSAQIAGQMPKKRSELLCSEKDAFRISLFEYALERQPCVLPIPGMASRIITYQRKKSAAEAAQASKAAAGTPDADTVFMCPDEPPPIHAGDIEADGNPLSVIESHVYAAPCVRNTPSTTDFLVVRSGKHLYVREIDSVISVGMTEPKIDVMAPNTERYKKYSKDRVLLWVMREFSRQRREITKQQKDKKGRDDRDMIPVRDPPYIEKEEIFREFPRRRTFPETSLVKLLKEHSRNENGKYVMAPEPPKGWAARETELLRTLTPQETAAYEAMESGWENLLERGVQIFIHPSGQGNILSAAHPEKSGLDNGTEVGKYLKILLLKTPWYRSQNIMAAHRQQQKELQQVLSLARIFNDLKEGGAVMESRLMSLTPAELNNVLTNFYKLNAKKIPPSVEERRTLLREMIQKKTKGPAQDMSDYTSLIRNVLKKHRDAGLGKGAAIAANGTAMASGTHLSLPLDVQLRALETGDTSELPVEEDDFAGIEKDTDGERPTTSPGPNDSEAPSEGTSTKGPAATNEATKDASTNANAARVRAILEEGINVNDPNALKKIKMLKVLKKIIHKDGRQESVVRNVTDPEEIARLLDKNKPKKSTKKPQETTGKEQDPNASRSDLKIAIHLTMLSQGAKANVKKKKKPPTGENKKVQKKPNGNTDGGNSAKGKPTAEKGRIGKIKISAKDLAKDNEQAALKRKRSQYGDEIDYNGKKATKTSRRKRNGTVELNGILERIEKNIRKTEGYVVPGQQVLRIVRLRDGESPPPGIPSNNLAIPRGTGLDFTAPVDTKLVPQYKSVVKKPMYLNLVRQKCKKMQYQSGQEFIYDMELLVENARLFNSSNDVQWVVQHAELLLEVAVEQVSRKADEIQAAEEMVKLEKSETRSSGAGPSSQKQKKKKQSSGKGNEGKRKKKKGSTEVVEIPDGPDKDNSAVPVIDLEEQSGPSASLAGALSPNPTDSSKARDAAMTDEIFALGKPGTSSDDIASGDVDKLVFDLGG